jgi:hypothetical protein
LSALEDRKLKPSSTTYQILKNGGFVHDFDVFKREMEGVAIQSEGESVDGPTTKVVEDLTKLVINNTLPQNEEYPQALCNAIVAGAVELLNAVDKVYSFEMKPVVKAEEDSRSNKHSDLSVLKIQNRRTYVVIECKLCVAIRVTADKKTLNDLAQLFIEGIYIYEEEQRREGQRYNKLLLVLTDAEFWHFFTVDMSKKPLKVTKYCYIGDTAKGTTHIPVTEVMKILVHNVKNEL